MGTPTLAEAPRLSDWVEEGQKAPDFALTADDGTTVHLADLAGRPVVLYFYPRDNTPGCTRQACSFQGRLAEIQRAGAVVLGVSPDPVDSHVRFRDRFGLQFRLLSDPDHAVAERYGAWREKNMYGRRSLGIQRSTWLVGPDGMVARVWKKVKVDGHDQQVLDELLRLGP